jgi:hypothetical protein
MLERQGFTQEPPCRVDTSRVRTIMAHREFRILRGRWLVRRSCTELHATHLSNTLQPLSRTDIPLPTFLDLGKDPRLDQCPTCNHNSIHSARLHFLIVLLRGETVAVAKHGWRRHTRVGCRCTKSIDAFFDVRPVLQAKMVSRGRGENDSEQTRTANLEYLCCLVRPWSCKRHNQPLSTWLNGQDHVQSSPTHPTRAQIVG